MFFHNWEEALLHFKDEHVEVSFIAPHVVADDVEVVLLKHLPQRPLRLIELTPQDVRDCPHPSKFHKDDGGSTGCHSVDELFRCIRYCFPRVKKP